MAQLRRHQFHYFFYSSFQVHDDGYEDTLGLATVFFCARTVCSCDLIWLWHVATNSLSWGIPSSSRFSLRSHMLQLRLDKTLLRYHQFIVGCFVVSQGTLGLVTVFSVLAQAAAAT